MKITKRQGTFHGSQKQSIMLYERQPYKQSEWKQKQVLRELKGEHQY